MKKKFLRFGGLGALHVHCVVLIQGRGTSLMFLFLFFFFFKLKKKKGVVSGVLSVATN